MKKRQTILAASILSADFLHLGEQIQLAEKGGADWIHLDVMDGHFVPNLSMGPFIVEACRRATHLPLDVHLMIDQPDQLLESFARAGADHLTIHVEACPDPFKTLELIRRLGLKAGISLKPETPVSAIQPFLKKVNGVLVMSVTPGYSGQLYESASTTRLAEVRHALDETRADAWLAVDGGINPDNIRQVHLAGANVFVSATAIFKNPQGIEAGILSLKNGLS